MCPLDPSAAALQRHAIESRCSTAELAREAFAVAVRLNDEPMRTWLSAELNGYPTMGDAPEYRWMTGQLRVHNAARGWIPFAFATPEATERYSRTATTQSVGELEALLQSDNGEGHFAWEFPPQQASQITDDNPYLSRPGVTFQRIQFQAILDRVRTRILEWAISLGTPEDGSVAPGATASEATQVIISAPITGSTVQIGGASSSLVVENAPIDAEMLRALIGEARSALEAGETDSTTKSAVEADLDAMDAQLESPTPRTGILRSLAQGAGQLLIGTASEIAAEVGKRLLGL